MAKTGYCNGSDVLISIGGKCAGHCTTHTLSCSGETKSRSVKPVLSAAMTDGLWDETSITKLSLTATASGLIFYNETECSFADLFKMFTEAKPIEVKFFERNEAGGSTTPAPYCVCNMVITDLSKDNPAGDDSSYSISLKNATKPSTLDFSKLTPGAATTTSGN